MGDKAHDETNQNRPDDMKHDFPFVKLLLGRTDPGNLEMFFAFVNDQNSARAAARLETIA
jgi:hypothetical protein